MFGGPALFPLPRLPYHLGQTSAPNLLSPSENRPLADGRWR